MTPPNILLIMTDQYNAECFGELMPLLQTPHLDRLAATGVRFDRAYTPCPICAPARSSIMRGQYCHTTGIEGNYIYDLDVDPTDTLADRLGRAGYRTGLVGKGHIPGRWVDRFEYVRLTDLCDAPAEDPTACHYFQYLVDHDLASYYEEGTARPGAPDPDDGSQPSALPYEHSIERFTGDKAIEFLRGQADEFRPFFLKLSFQRPHGPIRPSQRHFDLYDPEQIELPDSAVDWFENRFASKPELLREILGQECDYPLAESDPAVLRRVIASYFALITAIDEEIGRVLDTLQQIGADENTMILFTADHGEFAGEHGLFHKNLGIYESIHRAPLLIRHPQIEGGWRHGGIVETIDLYPTICEFAGVAPPDDLDGISLIPFLRDRSLSKDEALCEWSRIHPRRICALRTDRYRLVYYGREIGGELYDCENDPGELQNLWDDPAHAAVRAEMVERLLSRVMQYRSISEASDDRGYRHSHRFMPRVLLQTGRADWQKIVDATKPAPALDPAE